MAAVKEAKESAEEGAEEAEEAEASFGFNDPRYADLQLRLIVSDSSLPPPPPPAAAAGNNGAQDVDPSPVIHGLHNNDSSASTTDKISESGDSDNAGDVILHVSSLILGQSSVFFRGILDRRSLSDTSQVVIALAPQEVDTFLVVIKSLYCSQVKVNTTAELISVFRMANRFSVHACMDMCSQMMQKLTMTFGVSVQILESCNIQQQSEEVELFSLATSFLCSHFRRTHTSDWDSTKNDEWTTLSPNVLRIILSSDCLQVSFEEKAFEMLEMWMSANHKSCNDDHNERNRVLFEFGKLIRWPLMEWFCLQGYLKKFDSTHGEHTLRPLIMEALLYRASRIENARKVPEESGDCEATMRVRERFYHPVPVTFIRMNCPYDHGITFFSISASELDKLPDGECRYSERFCMGPYIMQWKMRRPNSSDDLYLHNMHIVLMLDYVSAPNSVEGDQDRPRVSLSFWQAKRRMRERFADMRKYGWLATPETCLSDNICSFRGVLELRAKV